MSRTVTCVVDGEEREREIDYIGHDMPIFGRSVERELPRTYPVTFPGEVVEWIIGDPRPHIFRSR